MALRRKHGYAITMIVQALQADVTYNVQFRENTRLGTEERRQILEHLSTKFGFDSASAIDSSIAGKNLYWGIADDMYLAQLESKHRVFARPHRTRLIPAGGFTVVDSEPDVEAP